MVSVIVPVHNGVKHIRSLVSCLESQIDSDLEVIFVNDGSRDGSLEELVAVQSESSLRISVLDQPNRGVSAARNSGLTRARGELICFCDIDDEITEDYISCMRHAIDAHNVDLVICKSRMVEAGDATLMGISGTGSGEVTVKDPAACLRDLLYGRIVSGCCTIMARRDVFEDNRLLFAEGFNYSEDLHMLWRIVACSRSIAYVDKRLYVYRMQTGSAMSRFDNQRLHGYELMKGLEPFFDVHWPAFAPEFRRYCAARMMWSIAWQAAVKCDNVRFSEFLETHHVRHEIGKLILFRNLKVSSSSVLFLLSPTVFRLLAVLLGRKRLP